MSLKIVAGLSLPEAHRRKLSHLGELVSPQEGALLMSSEELSNEVTNADALVVTITNPVTEEILSKAKNLKIIANVGAGFNNIDLEAATSRGIKVTNTPDVLTDATADLTLALILSAARRVAEGDRFIRSKAEWEWDFSFMWGNNLTGATLGIIGLGRIGLAVATRAKAFGMNIVAYGGRGDKTLEQELDIKRVDLDQIFSDSDFLSLHCPLNEETHHLVNGERFKQMKPNAVLINTSRGPVVDEDALVTALSEKQIAAAGLDVFENEPEVHPGLLELENVTLLPHLGSATKEVRTSMADLAVLNVEKFFAGEELITPIN